MIIYGTKGSEIGKGRIRNVVCPHCEANTEMNYTVFGRYAHIYWLPFFPIGRVNILECNSCKSTFDLKNLAEPIQQKFKNEKGLHPIKTPITHFSMAFVIGALITYFYFDNIADKNNEKNYLKSPKIGDVYRLESTKDHYSALRVTNVFKDSLYVLQNTMETNQKSGVDEINIDANYKEEWVFRRDTLEKMFNRDEIYEINRK